MDKEFESMCNDAGKAIMQPYITQLENIYIDADLLYDFKLGALMAHIKNEKEYDYIVSKIPDYLQVYDLKCAEHFPEMHLTDADLERVINNPKYEKVLTCLTPRTTFMVDIERLLSIVRGINKNKETTKPVHLYINEGRHSLSVILKRQLTEYIRRLDSNVILEFTNFKSWYDVSERFIGNMDFIGVYDIVEFVKEGTPTQKLLSAVPSGFAKTSISALAQISTILEEKDNAEEVLRNTASVFSMMCDQFAFLKKSLITKDPDNG